MDSESRNLQNDFFNAARKEKTLLTIFLSNGKKLVGRLKSFDKFTLLLESHHGEQIIFKHAVSTVSLGAPTRPPGRPTGAGVSGGPGGRGVRGPGGAGSQPGGGPAD